MANAPQFSPINHDDEAINRVQDHLTKTLDPLVASPLNGAVLVKNVVLKSGVNVVPHNLGRRPNGWSLARLRAALTVFDQLDTQTEDPTKVIRLNASAGGTVDILLF